MIYEPMSISLWFSQYLRLSLRISLFCIVLVSQANADVPDPLSCVVVNARMSQLLPGNEEFYLSRSLLFAFEHTRRDVPANADWSDPELRQRIAERIDNVYGDLPALLNRLVEKEDVEISADLQHCSGTEFELEIQHQVMILMLSESTYHELFKRHVLNRH